VLGFENLRAQIVPTEAKIGFRFPHVIAPRAGVDLMRLRIFSDDHHGLITRSAAERLGGSTAAWYRGIDGGPLELIHPGVARLPGAPATRLQAIAAAVLAVPGSLASHRSAAWLWGIPRPDVDPIELIVAARTRSPDLRGVIVHRPRDRRDLKPVLRSNIPTTNVLRLLCDLGAVDASGVVDAVGHVVTSRLASPVALQRAISRHTRRGRHGVPAFRDALANWVIDDKPVDSVLEPAMKRLFETYGLPPLEFHAHLGGYVVDFLIVGTPIVLECDGWEFHAKTQAQQDADAARDVGLAELGYLSLRFTYHQIVRQPARQARRIAAVIARWAPELGAHVLENGNLRAQKAV
ncbi:MAG: endonuclease domain-containing protein, partial [Ilumatobacteraceae bacterium]